MKIEWVAPCPELRPLVHSFYLVDSGSARVDEPTPAYSAQLVLICEGIIELDYENHPGFRADNILLSAPRLSAGRIRIGRRVQAVGASLTPLGWAALTGLPVNEAHDCSIEPDVFASPGILERVREWRERGASAHSGLREGLAIVETILREARHPVRPRHREFVERFQQWLTRDLSPPLEDLYSQLALSERQIQRLSRQFFGAAPSQVSMRHRAIRIAMLMSNPDLPQDMRDELIATYFDQAHMIRSIRRFTGRTPASLTDPSLAKATLDPAGHGDTAGMLRGSEQ